MIDIFVSGNHCFIFCIFVGSHLWCPDCVQMIEKKLTKEGMTMEKIAFILTIFIAPDIHEDVSHKYFFLFHLKKCTLWVLFRSTSARMDASNLDECNS